MLSLSPLKKFVFVLPRVLSVGDPMCFSSDSEEKQCGTPHVDRCKDSNGLAEMRPSHVTYVTLASGTFKPHTLATPNIGTQFDVQRTCSAHCRNLQAGCEFGVVCFTRVVMVRVLLEHCFQNHTFALRMCQIRAQYLCRSLGLGFNCSRPCEPSSRGCGHAFFDRCGATARCSFYAQLADLLTCEVTRLGHVYLRPEPVPRPRRCEFETTVLIA